MTDCLFCKIIKKEIPTQFMFEDDKVVAFRDINPQAPVHFIVIPKQHIESAKQLNDSNANLIGHVFYIASKLAKEEGLDLGYRIVNNCDTLGGQSIDHIHFHILGGRQMLWPPG